MPRVGEKFDESSLEASGVNRYRPVELLHIRLKSRWRIIKRGVDSLRAAVAPFEKFISIIN